MMFESIFFISVLLVLIIGTYTDFRWREVPDWLNYCLVFAAVGFRFIFTVITGDWNIMLQGIYGFIAMFVIALAMFYGGQWGGGDSKMVIGIGAMLGMPLALNTFLFGFLINMILFGSLFGIIFSVYLAATHWKEFKKEFKSRLDSKVKQRYVIWFFTLVLVIIAFFVPFVVRVPLLTLGVLVFFSFYVFIYLKSVEKSCMLIYVSPEELTEGDWIAEDIIVGKKVLAGPKDLGIEMPQIKKLIALKKKGKIKKILIKVGIPFVPSFLLAFIITYFWGNFVFAFIGL